ncbi:MAG TPA: gamma carbonic anhydrase family protein [Pseudomonadota bacterium]|jgi:carbonic anhydrase/acetyltransferase-like protein (isoleucine patch superfamily)|nr:gamma carbonic anhydrase family protein [Pseudomonadota bacterium]
MSILRSFKGLSPQFDETVFLADNATLVGDVQVGARSSVWFSAVLRGDVHYVRIGSETSIQDNTCVHVTHGRFPAIIGDRVTVGHSVTIHGCTIAGHAIIGMGATILDEVSVGERCIIGAGALLTPGTHIPPGQLVVGSPGRVKRPLTDEELRWIELSADHYIELSQLYRTDSQLLSSPTKSQ